MLDTGQGCQTQTKQIYNPVIFFNLIYTQNPPVPEFYVTYGFVEDKMKKDEYGRMGFGPVSSSSSISPCSAARAAASAALSKASSAALIGSL